MNNIQNTWRPALGWAFVFACISSLLVIYYKIIFSDGAFLVDVWTVIMFMLGTAATGGVISRGVEKLKGKA